LSSNSCSHRSRYNEVITGIPSLERGMGFFHSIKEITIVSMKKIIFFLIIIFFLFGGSGLIVAQRLTQFVIPGPGNGFLMINAA
jgi:hypothetical protein